MLCMQNTVKQEISTKPRPGTPAVLRQENFANFRLTVCELRDQAENLETGAQSGTPVCRGPGFPPRQYLLFYDMFCVCTKIFENRVRLEPGLFYIDFARNGGGGAGGYSH